MAIVGSSQGINGGEIDGCRDLPEKMILRDKTVKR